MICANGVFIIENVTNNVLLANFFTPDEIEIATTVLKAQNAYPVVHAYINGKEQLSYMERYVTNAMQHFLNNRIGDPRRRITQTADELYCGDVFRFTCMDTADALSAIKSIFESDSRFTCVYTTEVYSGEKSFEILPINATKANAALQLKTMLGCDRIVAFGDGQNDLSLFAVADEKYATQNAVPELKSIATAIIDSNDNDGVAKWIETNLL